jgi:NAD(P)-dependent dehydrogenase (short-subunit alcohol dehydrogenase family)
MIGITDAVSQEVGVHNIRVNALCPGAVNGELMQRVIAARVKAEGRSADEIVRQNYTDKASLRRWVEPEEVAAAALFLASPASAAITGERIRVDAGRT